MAETEETMESFENRMQGTRYTYISHVPYSLLHLLEYMIAFLVERSKK